jgi:(p)ppGpp synthase/HD superfamily hydrolase
MNTFFKRYTILFVKMTFRLENAIRIATRAHREQERKMTGLPFVIHPFSVMYIASNATDDEDVLIACLFHDIIEDVPEKYSEAQMRKEFGDRVVSIVQGVTKDSSIRGYRPQMEAYIKFLEFDAPDESSIVSAADKIHNIMSMITDYETVGDKLWNHFSAPKKDMFWYYESVLRILKQKYPDSVLIPELEEKIFGLKEVAGKF